MRVALATAVSQTENRERANQLQTVAIFFQTLADLLPKVDCDYRSFTDQLVRTVATHITAGRIRMPETDHSGGHRPVTG